MTTAVDMLYCVLAAANGSGGSGNGGGGWATLWQLAPFVAIVVIFFWLMNRSQRKKQEEREQMLDSIEPGDRVVTIGGIYGKVVEKEDDRFVLRINDEKDIKITISRGGLSGLQEDEEEEE